MASSHILGGPSRCGRVMGPSLDKIVKNVAWRKHSHLFSACKSSLDRFDTITDIYSFDLSSPIPSIPPADAEFALTTLIFALETSAPKVIEPALECLFKLFSLNLIYGEVDRSDVPQHVYDVGKNSNKNEGSTAQGSVLLRIVEAVCKLRTLEDEVIDRGVLRVLLSIVRSPCMMVRGDCLVHIVKNCYNVYLGSANATNQICAKAVLAQIMLIVFARVEEDSMTVDVKTVSIGDLLELTDKNLIEGSSLQLVQSFIYEVMEVGEGAKELKLLAARGKALGGNKGDDRDEGGDGEMDSKQEPKESRIREDGFLLFKNLCKLSMKFSTHEHSDDQILLRGKILSLELLKMLMDNAGPIWQTNERQVQLIFLFQTP